MISVPRGSLAVGVVTRITDHAGGWRGHASSSPRRSSSSSRSVRHVWRWWVSVSGGVWIVVTVGLLLIILLFVHLALGDGLFDVDHIFAQRLLLLGGGGGVASFDRLEGDEDESPSSAFGGVLGAIHRLDLAKLLEMSTNIIFRHLRIHAADENLFDFLLRMKQWVDTG